MRMASRVETATRHKREQCCYSFMHIVWPRRNVPLIGGHISHTLLRKRRGEVLEKVKKFRNTDLSACSPAELHAEQPIGWFLRVSQSARAPRHPRATCRRQ